MAKGSTKQKKQKIQIEKTDREEMQELKEPNTSDNDTNNASNQTKSNKKNSTSKNNKNNQEQSTEEKDLKKDDINFANVDTSDISKSQTKQANSNTKQEVTVEDLKPSKWGAIFAIIFGILLIAGGFFAYNYMMQEQGKITEEASSTEYTEQKQPELPNPEDYAGIIPTDENGTPIKDKLQNLTLENKNDIKFQNNKNDINKPIKNENESNILGTQNTNNNEATPNNIIESNKHKPHLVNQINNPVTKNWKANDYKHGDISTGKYTVISGDTLWELAEGAYGNGTQWHKIAQANNISYLPNGNPLIIPGQVLTIP